MKFEELAARVQPAHGLFEEEWHQHPYGGGWVQNTAQVDATAYIGPKALVLGVARVFGRAQVRDEACIKGNASIADDVVVCEHGKVSDSAQLFGNCLVGGTAVVRGKFNASKGVYIEGDHLHPARPQPHLRSRRTLSVLANGG